MELFSGHLSRKQVRGYIEKLVEEQMLKQDGDGKMRSDASLTYNLSIVLYADNPVLGRTLTSLAGYVIWYSFPVSWLVGDGCIGKKVIAKLKIITNLVSTSKTQSTTYSESSALHKELT